MRELTTARLLVRPFVPGDLHRCHAILDAGPEGGSLEQRRAWLAWTVAGYREQERLRQPPYGDRAIVRRDTGELIGACGLVPSIGPFAQLRSYDPEAPPGPDDEAGAAVPPPARSSPEVGIYYELEADHRGEGFATEAAVALIAYARDVLRLRRVVATTTYDNPPSVRVMERLGMRIEHNALPEPRWFQVVGTLDL